MEFMHPLNFPCRTALLHNEVMDSLEESVCIGGRDAQATITEISDDQLDRV